MMTDAGEYFYKVKYASIHDIQCLEAMLAFCAESEKSEQFQQWIGLLLRGQLEPTEWEKRNSLPPK